MVPRETSIHCPHCGKFTAVSPAPLVIIAPSSGMPNGIAEESIGKWLNQMPYYRYGSGSWWLGKCNACKQPLLVKDHGSTVYPAPQPAPVSEHVPEPMRGDLLEAKRCLGVSAWNAAVVMARRALQTAAVQQGAPKGKKLWQQIADLDDRRIITPAQRKIADAARWVGNHGAHDTEPDVASGAVVITEVTEEDAKDTVQFVEHLFETIYVAPVLAQKQLDKRGKSQAGPSKGT